ncbi:Probable protein disulfide-isomerase A6 [Galdieria sulphuraria]|nr:Probable protein disulfide-isomerase A6 [Galdieria sulphuraria]
MLTKEVLLVLGLLSVFCTFSRALYYPDLDEKEFDRVVDGSKPALVEFYAPWCGHCKNLAPEYERLGEAAKSVKDVIVAQVDADKHSNLAKRFGVQGFPTIKWFDKKVDKASAEDFSGSRTAESLADFIHQKLGRTNVIRLPKEEVHVVELNPENFDKIVLDPTKNVLVEFYAPWCGHCKALKPQYEKVAKTFKDSSDVIIASLDADANRDIAQRFDVSGFPTIKFFPATKKKDVVEYDSGRAAVDFVRFINKHVGTDLDVGGMPSAEASRIKALETPGAVEEVISRDPSLKGQLKRNAKYYLKVMEKYAQNGEEYIVKEIQRLENMLKNEEGNITDSKRANFLRRLHILKSFLSNDTEETYS